MGNHSILSRILVALLVVGVFAVGGVFAGGSAEEAVAEDIVLDFYWYEDRFVDTMEGYLEEFESQNPGVRVNLEILPFGTYWERIPLTIAGGQKLDALFLVSGRVQQFAENDAIIDIGNYIDDTKIDAFVPAQVDLSTHQGNLVALPFTATHLTMWVNSDMFDTAGIDIPATVDDAWTLEEFVSVLEHVKEANDIRYAMTYATREFFYMPFFYANGARLVNESLTGSAFNTDAARNTLSWFRELVDQELITAPMEDPEELFYNEQAAVHIGGSWDMSNMERFVGDKFTYTTTVFPRGEHDGVAIGGDYLAVSASSEHPEMAARLVDFLTSPEVIADYARSHNYLSPRLDVEPDFGANSRIMAAPMSQNEVVSSYFTLHRGLENYGQYSDVLDASFEAALIGSVSVDDAIMDIHNAIEAAFE